jgi:hypothetical protein
MLHGIMVYVAEVGEKEVKNGKVNARLRCIFENGTESNMLLRSLATELYKDETGRRILDHHEKALEALEQIQADDEKSGYLYVLQSLSTVPEIAARRICSRLATPRCQCLNGSRMRLRSPPT